MLSHKPRGQTVRSFYDLREYFKTLSDSARLSILDYLFATPGDHKVSDLARAVRVSQPLCSWHLRRLVKIGLVQMTRVGREVRCSLNRHQLLEFEKALAQLLEEREEYSPAGEAGKQHQSHGRVGLLVKESSEA